MGRVARTANDPSRRLRWASVDEDQVGELVEAISAAREEPERQRALSGREATAFLMRTWFPRARGAWPGEPNALKGQGAENGSARPRRDANIASLSLSWS